MERQRQGTTLAVLGGGVPSLSHESYLELIRNCGGLVLELLRDRMELPDGALIATSVSADLSEVVPTEYRADQVLAFHTPGEALDSRPALVVVVEVQLSVDQRKRRTWPIYVATAAGRHDCEVRLLVIAPDPDVARWAAGPFGPSTDFMLHPIVISLAEIPDTLDHDLAQKLPELAILVAIAHPSVGNAESAMNVIRDLEKEKAKLYFDLVLQALAEANPGLLELPMIQGYKYQSAFARKYYSQGHEEGTQLARREILAAMQGTALELARIKTGAASEQDEARIRSLDNDGQLSALIIALGRAGDPAQARAALASVTAAGNL